MFCPICCSETNDSFRSRCCKQLQHNECTKEWVLKGSNCPYCRDKGDFLLSHRFGMKTPKFPVGKYLKMRVGQAVHKVQVKGYKGRDPADPTRTLYKVYDFTRKRFVRAAEGDLFESVAIVRIVLHYPPWCCPCWLCKETYDYYFRFRDDIGYRRFDRVNVDVPFNVIVDFHDEDEDFMEGDIGDFEEHIGTSRYFHAIGAEYAADNLWEFHCNGWLVNWTFNEAQQCHFLAFRHFVPLNRRNTIPPYGRAALGLPN